MKETTYKSSFSPLRTEEDVLKTIRKIPRSYNSYFAMNEKWRKLFMDFMMGKKTLPLTYDPFFKKFFNCELHPERLSSLISSIIGKKVQVVEVLSPEETLLDGQALLIMDIIVRLEDGSLANVEIQKIPYLFPAERMSCYSADLVLRQYSRVKSEKGKDFKYNDLKKVYTIIFFEQSASVFKEDFLKGAYIHHGFTTFDTGLKLELLQEYYLISLDVFKETKYPKNINEQTAWLSLLTTENMADIDALVADYPWMKDIFIEMAGYLNKPEEVLKMFSEALKILDHNTVQYMIEELQDEVKEKDAVIAKDKEILAEKEDLIAQKDETLAQKDEVLAKKDAELKALKELIAKQGK